MNPTSSGALAPLVIVGPTASGKSGLALALATRTPNTRIISADAMAVYRGMDIGTAKPSKADREAVPHYLIDTVDPSEDYDVARFQQQVGPALGECEEAEAPVILVGGTGLYVRAVVDDFTVPPQFPEVRERLETEPDTTALWQRLRDLDLAAAQKMEPTNRRRVLRALEVCVGSGQPFSSFGPGVDAYPTTRFMQIGLDIDREVMDQRISDRYQQQLRSGFLEEVKALPSNLSRSASQALGYKELLLHLKGDCSQDEAIQDAILRTKRFARRQQRWFRRDPRIHWLPALAPDLVDQAMSFWHGDD